ncbi:LLM class flavin-dependent oxidoreductase [Nocardia veterana]|uniref:LLM class flavin-dependent oxidoreductase n=1 Tax=Nocardia veterana TaxID=132249 RepID=UPI0002F903BF|nr:LLM class flavin-dependent oxidoreductase [Nocardia veterana]
MTIRFGTMLVPQSGSRWVEAARAAERQGYHTLLLPDTLATTSPFPALAAAAAVTTTLRLRPNVLAVPLRTAATVVRETAALQLLSDGRFELGLGTGRPAARAEAEALGRPWETAARRRAQLAETVAAVRAAVDPVPPIVVAAAGPRMLIAAAEFADRVLTATRPQATEREVGQLVSVVREHTDRPIAFTTQLVGIGDRLPGWGPANQGLNAGQLREAGAFGLLPGDPDRAAEILRERHDRYGIDELIVPGELAAAFAPVLERFR